MHCSSIYDRILNSINIRWIFDRKYMHKICPKSTAMHHTSFECSRILLNQKKRIQIPKATSSKLRFSTTTIGWLIDVSDSGNTLLSYRKIVKELSVGPTGHTLTKVGLRNLRNGDDRYWLLPKKRNGSAWLSSISLWIDSKQDLETNCSSYWRETKNDDRAACWSLWEIWKKVLRKKIATHAFKWH